MSDPTSLEHRLAEAARALGAQLCVLFGSRATGTATDGSDVDIAIRINPLPGPSERLATISRLQDAVGHEPVDVVFLHSDTDSVVRFEALQRGVPVYEAESGLFVAERVRALFAFEDSLPFRRLRRDRLTSGHVA